MLSEIHMLARLTALEVFRNRIIPAIFGAMLILLTTAFALASVTMGSTVDIVMDLGLAGISIFCNLVAIVLTIQLTQQEQEFRTLYVLLPRLSSRLVYVLGKFVGLSFVCGMLIAGMGMMLAILAWILDWQAWGWFGFAMLATWFEVSIIVAVALLFSNATSLFLAIFYTIMIDITSRFTIVIKHFGEAVGGAIQVFTEPVFYLLPNLEAINIRNLIFSTAPATVGEIASVTLYSLTEIGLILCLAGLLYLRKDMHG